MKVGVSLVKVNREGKFLSASRKNDYKDFGFVGGSVEEGELPEKAIIREVKEETGYDLRDVTFLDARVMNGKIEYFYTGTLLGERLSNEQLKEKGEGVVEWVNKEVLYKGTFGELNKETIPYLEKFDAIFTGS